jgi:hypothetical protein
LAALGVGTHKPNGEVVSELAVQGDSFHVARQDALQHDGAGYWRVRRQAHARHATVVVERSRWHVHHDARDFCFEQGDPRS